METKIIIKDERLPLNAGIMFVLDRGLYYWFWGSFDIPEQVFPVGYASKEMAYESFKRYEFQNLKIILFQ